MSPTLLIGFMLPADSAGALEDPLKIAKRRGMSKTLKLCMLTASLGALLIVGDNSAQPQAEIKAGRPGTQPGHCPVRRRRHLSPSASQPLGNGRSAAGECRGR